LTQCFLIFVICKWYQHYSELTDACGQGNVQTILFDWIFYLLPNLLFVVVQLKAGVKAADLRAGPIPVGFLRLNAQNRHVQQRAISCSRHAALLPLLHCLLELRFPLLIRLVSFFLLHRSAQVDFCSSAFLCRYLVLDCLILVTLQLRPSLFLHRLHLFRLDCNSHHRNCSPVRSPLSSFQNNLRVKRHVLCTYCMSEVDRLLGAGRTLSKRLGHDGWGRGSMFQIRWFFCVWFLLLVYNDRVIEIEQFFVG